MSSFIIITLARSRTSVLFIEKKARDCPSGENQELSGLQRIRSKNIKLEKRRKKEEKVPGEGRLDNLIFLLQESLHIFYYY